MESVCMELQQRLHLLQLWDELAIFLGLFGGSRSERASYDRGIMCELYNPTGIVRRQLVSRTNVMVKPRLCILAAGHPRETINCLTGSGVKAVESNDDGLFNRFLIAVGLKRKPSRDRTPPDNRIPKLAHLFYYVHQLHKEPQEYSFNQEGNNIEGIPQSDIEHIKSYIKNHPSKRILLSVLPSNLKRKYTKDQYLPILRQMETDGEGTITTTENTTRPKAIVFIKKPRTEQASASSNNTTNDES
ncbi:unnamed protein product [Rotaria sordida]|uniref:Uncharacterized protein n=1 Tax=Rotaria sordida TaxID=392033 RepID=A0A815F0P6_9BILA|nr:unnamed protein product [Rotaria sordida]